MSHLPGYWPYALKQNFLRSIINLYLGILLKSQGLNSCTFGQIFINIMCANGRVLVHLYDNAFKPFNVDLIKKKN